MSPLNVLAGVFATLLVFAVGAYTNSDNSIAEASIRPAVIRLVAVDQEVHGKSVDPNDHQVFTQTILGSSGNIIGNSYSVCIKIRRNVSVCSGIYILPKGKITYYGSRQNRLRYSMVVTGGSGVYQGAGGKIDSIVFGFFPFREKITVHLI